jgi:hypothetical protein
MAIDFPNSPTTGQTFTSGTRTWTHDGAKWNLTSYGPVGPQGATGPQGSSGATGATGPTGPPATFMGSWSSVITYSLGQAVYYNGSSYVSRVNSNINYVPVSSPTQWGVLAGMGDTGPTGPQGFQGPAGGPQGSTGPQGAVGAQGIVGPQGIAGPQGDTGPQGSQGPTGSVGTIVLDALNDVSLPSPAAGDFLKYNGTMWVADDVDLGVDTSGILPVASGGTNSSATPTAGGVNYGTGTAHAFSGPGTSGQVLQSTGAGAPIWATYARGFVAQDTSIGSYPSTTTAYVYTDLDITATVVVGRKYKWTLQGHVYTAGSPDIIRVGLLNSGGSPLIQMDTLVNTTGTASNYSLTYYETATTTSMRRRVGVARATGSGTAVYHFADANRVASLTIEDVGI